MKNCEYKSSLMKMREAHTIHAHVMLAKPSVFEEASKERLDWQKGSNDTWKVLEPHKVERR